MTKHTVVIGATLVPVHYIHLRQVWGRELIDEATGARTVVDELDSYGGGTLAYVEVEDEGQPTVYAALSLCHDADRFQKRLGRDHSRGRLAQAILSNFRNGSGSFYMNDLDKIYVLPGPASVVLRELIEEIEDGTGYLVR